MRPTTLILLTLTGLWTTACDFDIDLSGTITETGELSGECGEEPDACEDEHPEEGEFSEDEWDSIEEEEEGEFSEEEESEESEQEESEEEDEAQDEEEDCLEEEEQHDDDCEELMMALEEEIEFFMTECDNGDEEACAELDALLELLEEECWIEEEGGLE